MDVYHERIQYLTPLLCAKIIRIHKSGQPVLMRWNIHGETELLLILEGGMDMFIEQERHTLLAGDVLLIGSNQLHRSMKHEGELNYLVLQFDMLQHFDRNVMLYLPYFTNPLRPLSALNRHVREAPSIRDAIAAEIQRIYTEAEESRVGFEMAVTHAIREILLRLLRLDPEAEAKGVTRHTERLQQVYEYVEKHLQEKLTAEDICREVNLSYYHMAHLFKAAAGMSLMEYLNYRRIKRAEVLLATSDISVAEAASSVGIPSLAHFTRLFKRWNQLTPKRYQLLVQADSNATQ